MKAIHCYLLGLIAFISCSEPINMDREKVLISKYISENNFHKADSIVDYLLDSGDENSKKTADSLFSVVEVAKQVFDSIQLSNETNAKESILQHFKDSKTHLVFSPNKETTLIFGGFSKSNKWIVDRYDDTYHYSEAERDMVYITSDVTVKSKSKDPHLPRIILISEDNGIINQLGIFEYRFYRWTDHARYIGLYHDNKNDFAYTESVKFTVGLQVSKSLLSKNTAIVVSNGNYFARKNKISGEPEVVYEDEISDKSYTTIDYANMHWVQSKI